MNTTNPSWHSVTPAPTASPPTPTPNTPEPPPTVAEEQIDLLQAQNLELQEQLHLARQELAGVSPLLLEFGVGTRRYITNGRTIRGMSLRQESTPYGHKNSGLVTLKPFWGLTVDDVMVTDFLPKEEAEATLTEAKAHWIRALTPPSQ